jgi:hypothetical protein
MADRRYQLVRYHVGFATSIIHLSCGRTWRRVGGCRYLGLAKGCRTPSSMQQSSKLRPLHCGLSRRGFSDYRLQKMRSSTHTSFSLFGLCFTYVTGALVILISVIIEPILTFFFKRRGYQRFRELEWATNQQLQLHRLAHEPLGYGKWTRATKFVPMTDKDEYLGRLDVSTNHPVITTPSTKTEHESSHDTETTSNNGTLSTNSPARDAEENPLEEQTVHGGGGSLESQAPNDAIMSPDDSLDPNGPLRLNDTTSTWDEVLLGNSQTRDESEEQTGNKTAGVTSVASSPPGEEAISREDVSPLDESPRRVQWQNPRSMT